MPLPPGLSTVTVTGTYLHPNGAPFKGSLLFQPEPAILTSAVHGTLVLGTVEAALDASGAFTVTLLATDDPDITPVGWTYRVMERWYDAPGRNYPVSLPAAAPDVDIADVAPTAPSTGEYVFITGPAGPQGLTGPAGPQPPLGAAGAGPTIALRSDDPSTTNARTPTAHAASHTAAGSDPVTLTQAQIAGLVAALAALAPLAGAHFTGDITIDGYTTLQGGQFNSDVAAFGDLQLIGADKRYRFRRSGANLDLEGSGADMILSVWSDADFGASGGTQRSYDRYSADATNVQHAGKREYVTALHGSAVHTIDPTTGVAALGAKNGLSNIRLSGFRNSVGAPTSGSWTSGDVVLDSAGALHLCTASGTPGTWT